MDDAREDRRRRFSSLIWLASAGAALALVLSVGGTLSAFSASIDNSVNSVGTGSIVMQETGPGASGTNVTCLSSSDPTGNNAATCSTINKHGNAGVLDTTLAPGASISTTVTIADTGTQNAAALTVAFGACTQVVAASNPAPGSLCGELNVALYPPATAPGTPIYSGTLAAAGSNALTTAQAGAALSAGGAGQPFTFVISLPAGAGSTYQGITVTQPITWTFSQ